MSRIRPVGSRALPKRRVMSITYESCCEPGRYHEIHVESTVRVFVNDHHLGRRPGVDEWVPLHAKKLMEGRSPRPATSGLNCNKKKVAERHMLHVSATQETETE